MAFPRRTFCRRKSRQSRIPENLGSPRCTFPAKPSGNTIYPAALERAARITRLTSRTQKLRSGIKRRRSCYASQPRSSAMPPVQAHRLKPATGTTSPAITAIMAVRPAMVASESSRTAAARARVSSISAAFDLRLSNEHRHSGARASANPESRDSGFSPAGCPGSTIEQKGRGGISPVASQFLYSLVQALRAPCCEALESLAGDPSEVTALGVRHWITSFRC
jgi:hypothetical protein